MLCVSIDASNYENCKKAVSSYELVELRLDKCSFSEEEFTSMFGQKAQIIATCRPGFYSDSQREEILLKAIKLGAKYVDIELESSELFIESILQNAKLNHCKTIISYHNHHYTPNDTVLNEKVQQCLDKGAELVKIVCWANINEDVDRLLSLYDLKLNLICFAMGEFGNYSRTASLLFGAPFTYVSMSKDTQTAEGQMTIESMMENIGKQKPKEK